MSLITLAPLANAESQRLFRSAYYLGRGDTGIAIADNHEAIFYNPAGLAQGKGIYKETILASPMVEASVATKDLVRKAALENSTSPETLADEMGKNQHFGIYNFSGIVFRRAALGAATSHQTNLLPRLSAEQRGLPVLGANTTTNQAITFSLAEQFWTPGFSMGLTGKYIVARATAGLEIPLAEAEDTLAQLDDSEVVSIGSGGGADFGLMYRTASKKMPFSLGITVQNIGGISLSGTEAGDNPPKLEQTVNIGIGIEPGTQFSRVKLLLDVRDIEGNVDDNMLKNIHIGTEIAIRKIFGVTTGFNQGYPTFGGYLNLYVVRIDMGSYTQEMGSTIGERPDQRFYFRLQAGF